MAPAIRKEGARSKLVFDTENSLKPGTITAQAGASSAGIGSVFYFMTSNTMGNITFNGGDIKAYIRDSDGAAIGGGDYSPGSDITISGGYIQAQGGKDAPGIGVKKGRHGRSYHHDQRRYHYFEGRQWCWSRYWRSQW